MIARPVSSIAVDGGEIVWFAHVTSDSGRTLEYVRHAMTAEEAEWLRGLDDTDWRSGDLTARYRTYEDALVAAQKWIDAR
jgi:hypothetical protein